MDGGGGGEDAHPHPYMAATAALITAAVSSASASFINPSFFSGTANEDARDWLTYLENWIQYKNIDPPNQKRLFPLLFRGSAAEWFIGLEDNQKDTFDHLQAAFQTRFFPYRPQSMADHVRHVVTETEKD